MDKSGSMTEAIEVGTEISALIAGVTEAPLYVVAFDTMAREIEAKGTGLTAWKKAFEPIKSHGGTSIGVALDYLIRKEYYVEQIIVVTDEGENNRPFYVEVIDHYSQRFKVTPNITIIYIKSFYSSKVFSHTLKQKGIAFDYYDLPEKSDKEAYPGLITMLSRNSKLDLLYEIMETPLPVRRDFDRRKK